MLREIVEANKKVTLKNLPDTISKLEIYRMTKTEGEYEYVQIDYDEFGDYGSGDDRYNQGLTLIIEVEVNGGKIFANSKVSDLGIVTHKDFTKKYRHMVFDSIDDFVKTVLKIEKEFNKL